MFLQVQLYVMMMHIRDEGNCTEMVKSTISRCFPRNFTHITREIPRGTLPINSNLSAPLKNRNEKGEIIMTTRNSQAYKIAMTGLLAALSYVVFTFGQIKISLPGGDATSIHLGNAVCVLGALLIGGFYGGLGGAIGMTIGDLLDPVYVIYAPKTFICKLCIGLITGLIAHKLGKIEHSSDKKHIFNYTVIAATAGLLFNVIADPLIGYYYKLWIIGKPAAELSLAWNVASTSINAVTSAIVSVVVYMALRPALRKAGLFSGLSA